jgi:hypothetical protein
LCMFCSVVCACMRGGRGGYGVLGGGGGGGVRAWILFVREYVHD